MGAAHELPLGLPPVGAVPPPPGASLQLSDRAVVALAVAVAAGAWAHPRLPVAAVAVGVAAALIWRRPALVLLAGFVLAAVLGTRAVDGLHPVAAGHVDAVVTLVADPQATDFGTRVDVAMGGKRVELRAPGAAAGAVEGALAGERLRVVGRLAPPRAGSDWLVPRHVVGTLQVDRAERVGAGAAPWRAANRFRRLIQRGSETMAEPTRSLYGGFVLGDDRNQAPEIVDDFRGAGLTHVLVVSGQN